MRLASFCFDGMSDCVENMFNHREMDDVLSCSYFFFFLAVNIHDGEFNGPPFVLCSLL